MSICDPVTGNLIPVQQKSQYQFEAQLNMYNK